MNARSNKKGLFNSMMRTPSLFVLAFLVLILSCPVKKILQDDFVVPASPRAAQLTNPQQQESYVRAASCCMEKKIAVSDESSRNEKTSLIPDSSFTEFFRDGFEIFHYLSRVRNEYHSSSLLRSSSLPIYLRHSRLLI